MKYSLVAADIAVTIVAQFNLQVTP